MYDIVLTLLINLAIAILLIANMYLFGLMAAHFMFKSIMTRNGGKNGKWSRICSDNKNVEQVAMWNDGLAFFKDNDKCHKQFEVKSGDIKLVGDYFDFGYDRVVILIPGRNETGIYSSYFAGPYKKAKCNVLVFDPRAHGLSSGEYSGCGILEIDDTLAIAEYAHNVLKNKYVLFHGVCLGGGSIAMLMGSSKAPDYVISITLDGLFVSFYELIKNHMIESGHPVFPALDCLRYKAKRKIGVDIKKTCPEAVVDKIKVPTLMLSGEQDIYSLPEKTKMLYEKLGASKKKLVWFKKGAHSHLKVNDEEGYEKAIVDWVSSL